ncbi:hypothetical protein [Peribacillus simplex]
MNEGRDPFDSSLASALNMRLALLAEEKDIPQQRLLNKSTNYYLNIRN